MKEAGKLSPRLSVLNAKWKSFLYNEYTWAYIAPKLSKITKIHGMPLLHEGYFRKNHKKRVKRGQLGQNLESKLRKFATCENLQPANYRLQNFLQP